MFKVNNFFFLNYSQRKTIDLSYNLKLNQSKLNSICFDDFNTNQLLCEQDFNLLKQIKVKIQKYEDMQNNLHNIEKLANRHLFDLQYNEKWDDFSIEILMKEETGNIV